MYKFNKPEHQTSFAEKMKEMKDDGVTLKKEIAALQKRLEDVDKQISKTAGKEREQLLRVQQDTAKTLKKLQKTQSGIDKRADK